MKFSFNYFLPLLIILISSFIYKVYLESKIKEPDKKVSILTIIIFQRFGAGSLLPLSTESKNEEERKLRIKANRALVVVYVCFFTIIVWAAVAKT